MSRHGGGGVVASVVVAFLDSPLLQRSAALRSGLKLPASDISPPKSHLRRVIPNLKRSLVTLSPAEKQARYRERQRALLGNKKDYSVTSRVTKDRSLTPEDIAAQRILVQKRQKAAQKHDVAIGWIDHNGELTDGATRMDGSTPLHMEAA
jgi:hypothetical protein